MTGRAMLFDLDETAIVDRPAIATDKISMREFRAAPESL
jgi:hypothetical protein